MADGKGLDVLYVVRALSVRRIHHMGWVSYDLIKKWLPNYPKLQEALNDLTREGVVEATVFEDGGGPPVIRWRSK